MIKNSVKKNDISIVLCGAAGQGIQTVEKLLVRLFKKSGYHIFATKEYMSRVRGGSNSTELRVSSKQVRAFLDRIDILVPFHKDALKRIENRMSSETIVIGEKEKLIDKEHENGFNIIDFPLSTMANDLGSAIYANIIITGVLAAIFKIESDLIHELLQNIFKSKGDNVIAKNIEAVDRGYEIGEKLSSSKTIQVEVEKNKNLEKEIIIDGSEAVSLGAIAGGCNFISTYPMSPSTAVLTFLAQHGEKFNIIAEQSEDEIAGMNMAIGAWYAGARAMVTTSGGGFALMAETLSLSGVMEMPLVIHLAQRPGPATGMPTRTEQGDLLFTLFAGHGDFPRIILSPGTLKDAFELTHKAFNLADKYQVPVFVLTDQYFVESYYNIPKIDVSQYKNEQHIVETDVNYKRYAFTDSGVSPRGIPAHGTGLVVADSHEHDQAGHISENHDIRTKMVNKRLKKYDSIVKEAIRPTLLGDEDNTNLVVCWGSTFHIVREAIRNIGRDDVSMIHFKQIYPLHPETPNIFKKPKKLIIVENNVTSQFAQLLKLHADIEIENKILKYNGFAFSVEEVENLLQEILK
jgi:2-oxoglutarate/2-oxoacid ferredoxin oxidoreductase subunit alpha